MRTTRNTGSWWHRSQRGSERVVVRTLMAIVLCLACLALAGCVAPVAAVTVTSEHIPTIAPVAPDNDDDPCAEWEKFEADLAIVMAERAQMLEGLAEYHAWREVHGQRWDDEPIIMLEEAWMIGERHRETLRQLHVPTAYLLAIETHDAWRDEYMRALSSYYDYYMMADEIHMGIGNYYVERSERQMAAYDEAVAVAREACVSRQQ